jgi:3-oxoacyl-[acyl-carrier-protein] synthase-3
METCMYMGGEECENGTLKSYMDYSPEDLVSRSVLSIKQDVKLLGEHIIFLGGEKLKEVCKKKGLSVDSIDYYLPHMSSEFFRSKMYDQLEKNGMTIPYEKWFVNLSSVGNVGAASIYLMVDELFRSGKLQKDQKILLLVPESARFSYSFALLTVC